jgi:cell division protein FtsA
MLQKIKNVKKVALARGKQRSTDKYIVALDVGTEFVKALVARIDKGKMTIVGTGRARQQLTDMQAGAIADIQGVVQNCNQALAEAEEQAGTSARSAVVGIAGELVKGTTITVKCVRKDPNREIDGEEMDRIISIVQERAEAKARQNLASELGGKHVEIRMVNSALVNITIDGYEVTNPIGFKGRNVVVQLYTAFAPMIHIAALERVTQELDLDLIAVAAEPFAVSRSVIGDDQNASMSAVLMDVGGGTTDIAIVNEGGVQGTKMFGIGGRAFTKAIEKELGVDFEMAEKLKLSVADNTLPHKQLVAATSALDRTCDVWISGVELALSEYPDLEHLPHKVLLCGGGASLEKLLGTLKETNWYRDLPFTRKPVIDYITPGQVIGITDESGKVTDHTFVTAMGLLRVGLDTVEQQDDSGTSSLRQRFDKILEV